MKLTEEYILEQTNGGLKTYQALLPNLLIQGGISSRIKSPFIAFKPDSFSIRKKHNRWSFDDKATGISGDIFDFMSAKTGLNKATNMEHLMEIIAGIYAESEDNKIAMKNVLFHKDNGTRLSFSGDGFHRTYLKDRFRYLHGECIFKVAEAYELYTVNSLSWLDKNREITNIVSGFRSDVPQIFFAFLNSLYSSEHALLYEPFFREAYDWGERPDNFILGHFEAMKLIESSTGQPDHLIITDTVELLLSYHAQGKPAIALVDKVLKPTPYLIDEVVPKFISTELHFERHDRYDIEKVYVEFKRKYGLKTTSFVI